MTLLFSPAERVKSGKKTNVHQLSKQRLARPIAILGHESRVPHLALFARMGSDAPGAFIWKILLIENWN